MATVEEQRRLVKARCDGWKIIPHTPLAKKQLDYPLDLPSKGPFWLSRTTISPPSEPDVRNKLLEAFQLLKTNPLQKILPADVPLREVRFEWMGPRAGVSSRTLEPEISENAKFEKLSQEARPQTILHVHGGAF